MQKKLLAVAVASAAGAFVAPFAAPTVASAAAPGQSTVQIYGTIYTEFPYYNNVTHAASVTGFSPDRVSFDYFRTAGSEIGIKGEEQLGGGLAAWFQCTSTADIRGSGTAGWCTRNSALGLKGFFGNLYVGIWDTPYKRTYALGNVGGAETGVFGNSPLLHNGATAPGRPPALANAGNATSAFATRGVWTRREVDSVMYDSPNFGGFQVLAQVQTANFSTNITEGSTNEKPRLWSIAGQYSAGPLGVGLFYERHTDVGIQSGATAAAGGGATPTGATFTSDMDDSSYGISAAYTFGPVKIGGLWKREKYDVPSAAGVNPGLGQHKVSAWHLGVDWNIAGPHGLRASYTRVGSVKGQCIAAAAVDPSCAGIVAATGQGYRPGMGFRPDAQGSTGASMWQIRYVFAFSKRTEMQVGYSRINNQSNAGYQYSDIASNVRPGADPSAWALTMQHKF